MNKILEISMPLLLSIYKGDLVISLSDEEREKIMELKKAGLVKLSNSEIPSLTKEGKEFTDLHLFNIIK